MDKIKPFIVGNVQELTEDMFVKVFRSIENENDKYLFEKKCHELTQIINESNMSLELIKTGVRLFDELWNFNLNREDVDFKISVGVLKR